MNESTSYARGNGDECLVEINTKCHFKGVPVTLESFGTKRISQLCVVLVDSLLFLLVPSYVSQSILGVRIASSDR